MCDFYPLRKLSISNICHRSAAAFGAWSTITGRRRKDKPTEGEGLEYCLKIPHLSTFEGLLTLSLCPRMLLWPSLYRRREDAGCSTPLTVHAALFSLILYVKSCRANKPIVGQQHKRFQLKSSSSAISAIFKRRLFTKQTPRFPFLPSQHLSLYGVFPQLVTRSEPTRENYHT